MKDLAQLLDGAAAISRDSEGLFDPAVGGLIRMWAFSSEELVPTSPPDAEKIQQAVAAGRPLHEIWRADTRQLLLGPGTAIDLGGFAKGVAVDMAIDLLRDQGIENAIVNAGGDLRAIGRHGDRAWRIGVRDPRGEGVLAAIDVQGDESVFTSGDYERYFIFEGRRYHHIIDPRDGYPAAGVSSVTVIHQQAAVADAAATALFVAGVDAWPRTAARLGVTQVMLVETSGTIHMSPQMEDRTWLIPDPKPEVEYPADPRPLIRGGDILILLLAAGLVGASFGAFWGPRGEGETAAGDGGSQRGPGVVAGPGWRVRDRRPYRSQHRDGGRRSRSLPGFSLPWPILCPQWVAAAGLVKWRPACPTGSWSKCSATSASLTR